MTIRLHSKYGLNPTMPVCILCEKPTGEIALLGASYKEEAPRNMIIGIEPCKDCKENYLSKGVLLIEQKDSHSQPTGIMAVITDEAFTRIFNIPIPENKVCLVETGLLGKIGIK